MSDIAQELLKEAANQRAIAKQYEGCSWLGDRHPAAIHRDRASLLTQAAMKILSAEEEASSKAEKSQ